VFRFASPYFLLLLAAIPLLIVYRRRREIRPAMGVSSLGAVRKTAVSSALRLSGFLPVLKYGALILLIVAMARPQWGTEQVRVLTEGINIVLAMDLSESMAALDFKRGSKVVNRLEAVKGVVETFIAGRNGDRIGLVVFGSHACGITMRYRRCSAGWRSARQADRPQSAMLSAFLLSGWRMLRVDRMSSFC